MKKIILSLAAVVLTVTVILSGCSFDDMENNVNSSINSTSTFIASDFGDSIPYYKDSPYSVLNGNEPYFDEDDFSENSFETYSPLDSLGRCSAAYANISTDTMPTEERGSIGQIKPSGWQTVKYDIVDGKYLYNRCHLIGWQLTAENANAENLITGTRYLNVTGMLPFENMVADYIKETGNHVLYRVTPLFFDDDLLAYGVRMEAKSVEDNGEGICFHVFCYNVQPGIEIDYSDGSSSLIKTNNTENKEKQDYVINKNSGIFHLPDCSSVSSISDKNRENYNGTREELIEKGLKPCGRCNP